MDELPLVAEDHQRIRTRAVLDREDDIAVLHLGLHQLDRADDHPEYIHRPLFLGRPKKIAEIVDGLRHELDLAIRPGD